MLNKHEKLCGEYARLQEHNTHQKRQLETQGNRVSELQNQLKHVQDQLEKQEQAAFSQAGGMFVSGFSGNGILTFSVDVMSGGLVVGCCRLVLFIPTF